MPKQVWIARREEPGDAAVIREITLASFGKPDEARIVDRLRASPSWIPALSQVTTTERGEVVGHALLTRCGIGDVPALCLGPCSVKPEFQRGGAGSAAIRAGLAEAENIGEQFVVVLGHPEYYPRFGFEPAFRYGISSSFQVPPEALMVLSLRGDPIPGGLVAHAPEFGV